MNIEDRPTPETDCLVIRWTFTQLPKATLSNVILKHARNLERQKAALREALETILVIRNSALGVGQYLALDAIEGIARATLAATNPTT